MWLILTLFFSVGYFVYAAYTANFTYWKKRGVPHPPFSKLFGNIKDAVTLKKSMAQVYHEIYKKYSLLPYVGVYQLRKPVIIINNPELLKDIMIKNFNNFHLNDIDVDETNDKLVALTPFFANSYEQWKESRTQMMSSFTNKQMRFNFPIIESVCKKLIHLLTDPKISNGGIDIKELCQKYTMDVVANCVMGLEANSLLSSDSVFMRNIKKIISPDIITNIKINLSFFIPPLAKLLQVRLIPDDVANYFKNILKETMEYRIENKVERNDALNILHELQLKLGKEKFSNDHITVHVFSYFLDGFETSAIVLSYALYELGANKQCQSNLREEINNLLKINNNQLNFDIVQEMKYLNKVITETLRLYPANMILRKRCTKEYYLPPIDENGEGVVLEPGTPIIIPIYSLHTDSRYFADSHRFDPERFSEGNSYNKFTFLPFGEGPRMCVGQKFALTQIKIAIIHILRNFEIDVNKKTITPLEIDPGYFLMAAKGGIWLNFSKLE